MILRCNKNRGIVFPHRSSNVILIYNSQSFDFPCLIITHDICGLNLVVITSLPGWHWFYWKGIKSVNHTDKVERASKNVFAEDLKCLSPAWRPFEMIKTRISMFYGSVYHTQVPFTTLFVCARIRSLACYIFHLVLLTIYWPKWIHFMHEARLHFNNTIKCFHF